MSQSKRKLRDGEQTTVPADDLEPHPRNEQIYTNDDISDLVEKIDQHGFREEHRLLATPAGTILSGHRRWRAAKQLGIDEVPVEVKAVEDDREQLLEILLANQHREKTPAEKINEGEAWEEIEQEKAKERQREGGKSKGTENFPEASKGETRDKVGEKIGMSGRSYDKGKQVKKKADEGDEAAQEEWEGLESGEQSIHGAHESVTETDDTDESEESEQSEETDDEPEPDETTQEDAEPDPTPEGTDSRLQALEAKLAAKDGEIEELQAALDDERRKTDDALEQTATEAKDEMRTLERENDRLRDELDSAPNQSPQSPDSRADELEAVIRDVIRAFNNQDAGALERVVERAEGVTDDE